PFSIRRRSIVSDAASRDSGNSSPCARRELRPAHRSGGLSARPRLDCSALRVARLCRLGTKKKGLTRRVRHLLKQNPSGRPLLLQRTDVAGAVVLAADEPVRPRPLAALGRVVREHVADVPERFEVVRAREVGAQPVVRARALALLLRARALEVLRVVVYEHLESG